MDGLDGVSTGSGVGGAVGAGVGEGEAGGGGGAAADVRFELLHVEQSEIRAKSAAASRTVFFMHCAAAFPVPYPVTGRPTSKES
jgi:hypothetical protein